MNIYIVQVYSEPGANFNFGYKFQNYLHKKMTEFVVPSIDFIKKYENYEFVFRINAKKTLKDIELKGPTIFKRDKDFEYNIILPFNIIIENKNFHHLALKYIFKGIYKVFEEYNFEFNKLKEKEDKIIKKILDSPEMFVNH